MIQSFQTKDAKSILLIIFHRMLMLKNQLLQGSISYNSTMNRQQLKDSCQILLALLPAFLLLLIENSDILDAGQVFYPVMQMS